MWRVQAPPNGTRSAMRIGDIEGHIQAISQVVGAIKNMNKGLWRGGNMPSEPPARGTQTSIARRNSAIEGETTRHAESNQSHRSGSEVEEIFGWMKTVGGMRSFAIAECELVGGCSRSPARLQMGRHPATARQLPEGRMRRVCLHMRAM